MNIIYYLFLVYLFIYIVAGFPFHTGELLYFSTPENCNQSEYYNVLQLRCLPCNPSFHLVPSSDGLTCICNDRSSIVKWNATEFPTCSPCDINEIPTLDQRDCITCPLENLIPSENGSICDHFHCPNNSLMLERTITGLTLPRIECSTCPNGTYPTPDQVECVQCDDMSSCPPSTELDLPADPSMFTITYLNGRKIFSTFFQENLQRAIRLCRKKNVESCEALANMCVMVLYDDEFPNSPCIMFREHKRIPTSSGSHLPWIYYGEGDAPSVLSRRRISAHYELHNKARANRLNLTASLFSPDGKFLGVQTLAGHDLLLCPGLWEDLDRSLQFLITFDHSCTVSSAQLLQGRSTLFMDLFLSYQEASESVVHAVPILIRNMPPEPFVNSFADRSQWQLVRRWFLIDTTASSVLRYAASTTLHIRLRGRSEEGKIFVPYFAVDYAEIHTEHHNTSANIRFKVIYEMDNSFSHAIEISIGVLSAVAVVCAGIKTWSYSKRSGRLGIDLFTLGYLVLFSCGYLANVFFFVTFCACVNVLLFFKGQSVIYVLLPTISQNHLIESYIFAAFVLKMVEIVHLVYRQVTVDIFLVDWERPRARSSPVDEQPISIWRTYFVANEWNEIQAMRRVNFCIHLIITVFILQVVGVEGWASADPYFHLSTVPHLGIQDTSSNRFAVGGIVYLVAYFTLWVVTTAMYERYIKNGIQGFVDMCSMANVSVFILALENYGFYIHGRSAHGFADTDMITIVQQLQREEEDLVGHRGLLPGSDQQTFEMTVPPTLRAHYTKVMMPLNAVSRSVRRPGKSKLGKESVERSVQAYHNMNRFLGAFLDHALKDLDYEVRDKLFAESLLGIEFVSSSDKGVFYSDNGHSFDQVLFYGNEMTLLTFDLMVFSFVLVLSNNSLVAGAVTGLVAYLLDQVRCYGGRQNLAKKTLTDERFLI